MCRGAVAVEPSCSPDDSSARHATVTTVPLAFDGASDGGAGGLNYAVILQPPLSFHCPCLPKFLFIPSLALVSPLVLHSPKRPPARHLCSSDQPPSFAAASVSNSAASS